MTPILLSLALVGCVPGEDPVDPPIGEFIEGGYETAGYEAAPSVGNAPLAAVVRAVNQYGAAVGSEPAGILVDGVSQTVAFDALGYGTVRVDAPGSHVVDDGQQVVTVQAFDATWPGFGVSRAFSAGIPAAGQAVGLTTGAVVASGRELWFVGPDSPPHRVLNADGQIKGIQAAHIDVDGVLDVVAWSEINVYLLRGRLKGGVAWGAALTASRHRVGGAAVGELTGDNLPDLVVAWTTDEGPSMLDAWHGNGLFGFTSAEPRELPAIPVSVSIGDQTKDEKNQITVLSEEGTWSRFIAGSEVRYMPIGPNTPSEISIDLGSTVEAWGDLNGDGGDEMWFIGPLNPGSNRSVTIVDLIGTKIEFLPLNPLGAQITRQDLDGNGITDHVELHESRSLRSLSFDETSSNAYTPRQIDDLPDYGPIVMDDIVDQDGIPDLFVAGDEVWWWWRGYNDPTASDVFWHIGEQAMVPAGGSMGPILVRELDDDPTTTELLGFEDQSGNTAMVLWSWDAVTESVQVMGSTVVSPLGLDVLDVAQCEDYAWVLLEGGLVGRVAIANPFAPVVSGSTSTQATRIDCGAAPNGGKIAVLENGSVDVMDISFNVLGQFTTPGAVDLAIGDVGAGPEVRTCDTAGCSIVHWPHGEGAGAFATGTPANVTLDDGEIATVKGAGAVSVYDVDADGHLDLLAAASDGRVTVHRSNGEDLGFEEVFHTRAAVTGAVAAGNADGDGEPDLWVRDATNQILHSVRPFVPGTQPTGTGGTTP